MVSYEEALQTALTALPNPVGATVPLEHALGYVLAEDIAATVAWPRSEPEPDVAVGEPLLAAGNYINAAVLALLASQGRADVPVWAKPVAAVLTAGNELVEAGSPLSAGRVYNSSGPCLRGAIEALGILPIDLGTTDDDPEAIRAKLDQGLCANLLVMAGGARVCHEDRFGHQVMECEQESGKLVRITKIGGTTIVWIPGEPASALIKFHLFIAPLLRALMGFPHPCQGFQPALLAAELSNPEGSARRFVPAKLAPLDDGRLSAHPLGGKNSRSLKYLAQTDGLIDLPAGPCELAPGETVCVMAWR